MIFLSVLTFGIFAFATAENNAATFKTGSNNDDLFRNTTTWTPIIFMHGINGGPEDFDTLVGRLKEAHPGQTLIALDLYSHATSFFSIWDQIPRITQTLQNLTAQLDSFHLVCHSQGGIVCRAALEVAEMPNIDKFISLAGVQQGVRGIPDEYVKFLPSWLNNVTDDEVYHLLYTELGQSISFGNYWRDTAPIARADYLKSDNFLPVIDNDPESEHAPLFAGTAAQRKANFMNLNELHLFGSPEDSIVEPWDSTLFATVNTSNKHHSTIPMKEQPLYINDWFGLRTIDESGRLKAIAVDDVEHSDWLHKQDIFTKYLEPIMH